MANPTPNAFVSVYKHYRIKLVENTPPWLVETRTGKTIVGQIRIKNGEGCFIALTSPFTHTQLLDIAAAIKAVEKRTENPELYK